MNKIHIGKQEVIHFIGIGGIGMSGLAQIMKTMGFNVQGSDINENKTEIIVKIMIMAAMYEFMFMHKIPIKVVISEYLKVADFFVQESQKGFLNAILDRISKVSRVKNG
jgi:UDP-N-acetylmuramate-alanine ligase